MYCVFALVVLAVVLVSNEARPIHLIELVSSTIATTCVFLACAAIRPHRLGTKSFCQAKFNMQSCRLAGVGHQLGMKRTTQFS